MTYLIGAFGIIIFGILFFIGFDMVYSDANPAGIPLILLAIVIAGFAIWYPLGIENWKFNRRMKKIREQNLREETARKQNIESGNWEFPAKEFYLKCRKARVTSLDNEFSIAKATQIAEQIISEYSNTISLKKCGAYLKKERLEEYIKEGKILADKERKEKLLMQKQPKNATPLETEETFMQRALALYPLHGKAKRIKMLETLMSDYSVKINDLIAAKEAMKTLGVIYLDQQKKENSWALMGGIAEGIAGPVAGLAVAVDTMANNAKIREHNAAVRSAAMEIMSGVPSLGGDISSLRDERSKISEQLSATRTKIVLSKPTSDEIWGNMKIGNASFKKNPSGVLTVSIPVSLKDGFKLDVPNGVGVVIDGALKGEVWFNDSLVGEVVFPLPMYGIACSCNMSEGTILDGMCGRSVEYNGKYTLKLADKQNLWVMER